MTWEIAVGLFTLLSAFLSVTKVVLKVNRTLTSLEIAVNRLNEFMENQSSKNQTMRKTLREHEARLAAIEQKMSMTTHRPPSQTATGKRDKGSLGEQLRIENLD